jgi:hypothetical protein
MAFSSWLDASGNHHHTDGVARTIGVQKSRQAEENYLHEKAGGNFPAGLISYVER